MKGNQNELFGWLCLWLDFLMSHSLSSEAFSQAWTIKTVHSCADSLLCSKTYDHALTIEINSPWPLFTKCIGTGCI